MESGGGQDPGEVEFRRTVGMRIRIWRVVHDRSQEDLARSAGVTRNFVSAIERGAQGLDAVRLRRLAAAMDVELAELLAEPDRAPDRTLDRTPDCTPDRTPEPSRA